MHQEIARYLRGYDAQVTYRRREGETLEQLWRRISHRELDAAALQTAVLTRT